MNIFSITGVPPEVLAYAMAKYSRSAMSLQDSIKEISEQKAAKFLNTFYFDFGHKSIGDMAMIPLAVENISILAAIELVEEQLWNGQERSTRYQDFSQRHHYLPLWLSGDKMAAYEKAINVCFDGYDVLFQMMVETYLEENPKPVDMNEAAYNRTIRARAFDVARYLLPMATHTSVGQVTNARTLENQIARLMASQYDEVRTMANEMKLAAIQEPPMNPAYETRTGTPIAPTLVKYANPDLQRKKLGSLVKSLVPNDITSRYMGCKKAYYSDKYNGVKAYTGVSSETMMIASMVFEFMPDIAFDICVSYAHGLTPSERDHFITTVLGLRGAHDELLKYYRMGSGITFEIKMDIGGMRDLHRHRRANFVLQQYDTRYSPYISDDVIMKDKIRYRYGMLIEKIRRANAEFLETFSENESAGELLSHYLLPLGQPCSFLMNMDEAEVAYIAELRTGPAGHISYRKIAWLMHQALEPIAPFLYKATKDRVTDPFLPVDFFQR